MDELQKTSMRLRSAGDGLRWSAPESWHITLQFLGNAGQQPYECIVGRLRALRMPPVPIGLGGIGFFDRAGIVFASVQVSPELCLLQLGITQATQACGFVPETRPYQPHITLARAKAKRQLKSLIELKARIARQPAFPGFVAQEFLLYESFLLPAGARHEVRERFPLGHNR
jgi:2'-5' RNA ligase